MKMNKDLFWSAYHAKCPRCNKSSIFGKYLEVRKKCETCGLELTKSDIGDGAVFFSIVLVGTLITLLAVKLDSAYPMNLYAHILIWTPITLLATVWTLRIFKSLLVCMQYDLRKDEFDGKED